jgi:hypothetical protein
VSIGTPLQITRLALKDVIGRGGVTSIDETTALAKTLSLGCRRFLVLDTFTAQSDTKTNCNGRDNKASPYDLEGSAVNHGV